MRRDGPALEPRGLSRCQAAARIGIGVTLFDRLVAEGAMPRPRVIYGRRVWDRHEIDDAFDDLPHADDVVDAEKQTESDPWEGATV